MTIQCGASHSVVVVGGARQRWRIARARQGSGNPADIFVITSRAEFTLKVRHSTANRPIKNGNLSRQRKNPDRASAHYTACPGFFRWRASHHF